MTKLNWMESLRLANCSVYKQTLVNIVMVELHSLCMHNNTLRVIHCDVLLVCSQVGPMSGPIPLKAVEARGGGGGAAGLVPHIFNVGYTFKGIHKTVCFSESFFFSIFLSMISKIFTNERICMFDNYVKIRKFL